MSWEITYSKDTTYVNKYSPLWFLVPALLADGIATDALTQRYGTVTPAAAVKKLPFWARAGITGGLLGAAVYAHSKFGIVKKEDDDVL
jgi:hypothetical protein